VQGLHGEGHEQPKDDPDPKRRRESHDDQKRKNEKHPEGDPSAIRRAAYAFIDARSRRCDRRRASASPSQKCSTMLMIHRNDPKLQRVYLA
jgi:hypothetical protein